MKDVAGMTDAECYSMSVVYSSKLDAGERLRIEKLEIFDEFEEWYLLQSHYCLCLGKRVGDKAVFI
jgi:tRNA wybutosine-synthesizing protein 4